MPLLQQIYHGWSVIYGDQKVVSDVAQLIGERAPDGMQHAHASLPFDREIRFEKVSFSYQPALPEVLSDLNLSIPKGSRIGVIGSTGSGKSTAMDLLLGLLQPTSGQITVDGCVLTESTRLAWQKFVAHVPQAIFLADSGFAENIAFGVERDSIDIERVREAARQAQLDDFICSCPLGYATRVGERGVRISGGQRQRIGIARALYRRATVLVFDEATSSLDSETEASVMQAIDALEKDLTIILIAHRLTTLKGCDVIYRLDAGRIVGSGSYESMCRETENSTSR
jgi:ATP-binding cassette subfamily B protein